MQQISKKLDKRMVIALKCNFPIYRFYSKTYASSTFGSKHFLNFDTYTCFKIALLICSIYFTQDDMDF